MQVLCGRSDASPAVFTQAWSHLQVLTPEHFYNRIPKLPAVHAHQLKPVISDQMLGLNYGLQKFFS
jgi:hypothetical protein